MCLYPKLIKNPKYKPNKKNGGIIPPITDERVLLVPIGCGKCIECRKQKARNWQVRLSEEIKTDNTGQFITLTFSPDNLSKLTKEAKQELINETEENEIATLAVRRFLERWRKKHKKSIKHWLITELGHNNTERIHIHGILFTNKPEEIQNIWQYGIVTIGNGFTNYVNEKTINYLIKYMTKIDIDHKGYEPKILTSPGIGSNYFKKTDHKQNQYKKNETKEYYKTRTGLKLNLPMYYRNKIYTEQERELLWIEKLNKQERWICGEKIDISKSEESYYKTLDYYRKKNKRLGFGDDTKEWSKEQYIIQRKNFKKINQKKIFKEPLRGNT